MGLLLRNDTDKYGSTIRTLIDITETNEQWASDWRAKGYIVPISWNNSMQVSFRNSLGKLEKLGLVNGVGHRWVYDKNGVIRWKLTDTGAQKATEIRTRIQTYVSIYSPLVF
ncbi:MAG: hypothetical protein ABSA11_13420 [Candidatus Bathyarchaeia archaeon]